MKKNARLIYKALESIHNCRALLDDSLAIIEDVDEDELQTVVNKYNEKISSFDTGTLRSHGDFIDNNVRELMSKIELKLYGE